MLYVSEDYRYGYVELDMAARRPRTRACVAADVLKTWRGLAVEANTGGKIIGALAMVRRNDTRCTTRIANPSNCDSDVGSLSYSRVRVEPKLIK